MAKKTRMIRKPRKAKKRPDEPNILERLKKLSDSAPITRLPGGSFSFQEDFKDIKFKDK